MLRTDLLPCSAAILLLALAAGSTAAAVTFAEPFKLSAGSFPSAVAAADWDGDGALDLVVVHRTSDDAYFFRGDGTGGFEFVYSFAIDDFPQGVIAVDLNGDNFQDLVTTARLFANGSVSAWLGNGDGTFQAPQDLPSDDGTRSVAAVDLDGDSKLDLVATNSIRGNVSVFLGDGDGTFSQEIRSATGTVGSYPTGIAVADFDGNGIPDVATSNAQSADNSVGLLLGDGDGTFADPLAFPTLCNRPESIATEDFNRDGHPDLAVGCFFSSEIAVMLGDGLAGFSLPQTYALQPSAANPLAVLSGDFNHDSRVDLVSANNGSFALLLGNGDGSFVAPQIFEALPGSFYGGTTADLDGDGWLDLVLANNGVNEVWIYLNRAGACGDTPCPGTLSLDGTDLAWSGVPDAIGYDVVRGNLSALLLGTGDFASATLDCLVGVHPATSWVSTEAPSPGQGYWYLVRGVTAEGTESFDAFAGNLLATRDSGIAASGQDCP